MTKRKLMAMVFLLLLSASLLAAGGGQNLTQVVQQAPSNATFELFKNWQALAAIALVISTILVGIGYMVGIGFQMPEMEAWARSELGQVFANAVIIVALIATVAFIDMATMTMVNASGVGGLQCSPGQNCLNKTANAYLQDYIDTAKDGAKNVLHQNLASTAWANRRFAVNCYVIYCAQIGVQWSLWAHYVLDSDRYTIVFEYYQGVLSSLYSQKFFVSEICFVMGPLILAFGIVARSFFLSRKVGGLLIAIAAGMMFFFPAMYIFDWMSLDMTITGDKGASQADNCPVECSYAPPIAYYHQGSEVVALNTTSQVYAMFDDSQFDSVRNLVLGKTRSMSTSGGITITSCDNFSTSVDDASCGDKRPCTVSCDRSCRELPYPSGSNLCANYTQQRACADLPVECKVMRIVVDVNTTEASQCPAECKIVPPMQSNCNVNARDSNKAGGNCLQSRFDCRVAKISDLSSRPSISTSIKNYQRCNDYTKDCVASTDASQSCVWVMPDFGSCDDLCGGCPEECRITNTTTGPIYLPDYCTDENTSGPACAKCPATCKVTTDMIKAVAPKDSANCSSCSPIRRIIGTNLPAAYLTDTRSFFFTSRCSPDSCPLDYRVQIPSSVCETCGNIEEKYTYNPPIDTECTDLCKPPDGGPSKSSGDYTAIGAEGLVGRQEIQAVSKFMGPAYLLPLLNIAATLIVIRSLSEMLGGDVEIPGISRIF